MAEPVASPTRRPQRAKRVAHACDYCRRKRLKCTADQYPCLNCQLYNAECTTRGRGRRAAARASGTDGDPEAQEANHMTNPTQPAAENDNAPAHGLDSPGDAHPSNSDIDLNLPASQWTEEQPFADIVSQDFDHALGQLGVSEPTNPGEWDEAILTDFCNVGADVSGTVTQAEVFWTSRALVDSAPNSHYSPPNRHGSKPASTATSSNGRVSCIQSLTKPDANAATSKRTIPPGVFVKKDQAVANYIGLTSVGATLAVCLKDALESQQRASDASSGEFLIETGSHVDEVGVSSLFDLSSQKIPSRDVAMRSIDAYFHNLNDFYPILDEESFRVKSELFYSPARSQLTVLDYSSFYLVVSLGAMSISHNRRHLETFDRVSIEAYDQAWFMIHGSLSAPSEASLQVLLLHIVHHFYLGRCGVAWVFCGLAIRTAESLGVHRKTPKEMDMPASQLWLRSRLWWILLDLDASLSMSQGRPPGLTNATYDLETSLPEAKIDDSTSYPRLSQVLPWAFQLNQIQSRFCSAMHSDGTTASRLEAIATADRDLQVWKDGMPPACRPDDHIAVSPDRYFQIVLLHLSYFNLVRTVHWAATTLQSASTDHRNVDPNLRRFRSSEILCVQAARSFIKTLNDTMGDLQGKRIVIISFQKDNYVAAIAVLYRSISCNPSSFSARADLEYLRAGKIHLDLDTPSTGTVPGLRTLLDNMVLNAQDLVWRVGPS